MSYDELLEAPLHDTSIQSGFEVDLTKISSAVLARLVDEVKNDDALTTRSYDRVHNRHNR